MSKKKKNSAHIQERLQVLQQVAVELMSSHDLSETLGMIVNKAVDLLVCDAGSLYVKNDEKTLAFEIAHNRSIHFEFKKQLIPIDGKGLAAYSFRSGQELMINDVEKRNGDEPYEFNSAIDSKTGYRTRSVLICPLKSKKGEVLGVLQIVNRKQSKDQNWPSHDIKQIEAMPHFTQEDADFLKSFAAIASASLENTKLYKEIESLFEGFVTAAVHAIESRDLATRGHSDRVAHLTVELAKKVTDSPDLDVKDIQFSHNQLAEIRYAALLHDFGKIGVKESTLLKEEKLNPLQKLSIRSRFDGFKNATEIRILRDYLKALAAENRPPKELEIARIENQIQLFGMEIEKYWDLVLDLNRPTVLDAEKTEKLDLLTRVECIDCAGHSKKLLHDEESFALKIKKGSLTEEERLEIESHVTHTYEFLRKIPWTPQLRKIPEIAYGHHERLTGRGYPRKLTAETIIPQARIMAICDIFDALVASDRPYKASLPIQKALDILEMQTRAGDLDAKFFRIFVEAKVFENEDFKRDLKANAQKSPSVKKAA